MAEVGGRILPPPASRRVEVRVIFKGITANFVTWDRKKKKENI